MRLSDAMALGRTVIETVDANSFCGCAIGMGLAALSKDYSGLSANKASKDALANAVKEWPWLEKDYTDPYYDNVDRQALGIISRMFFDVSDGSRSLESLIDWVRSVEPSEEIPVDTAPVEEVEYASMT